MIAESVPSTLVVVGLYWLTLLSCAVTDFLLLKIPNMLVLSLVILFAISLGMSKVHVDLAWHIIPAFVALGVGTVLFQLKVMPGGDVKLLTAAILWVGIDALPAFLIWLAIAGLAVTLAFVVVRRPLQQLFLWAHTRRGRAGFIPISLTHGRGHVPYGIVIATAAVATTGQIPLLW
jgi:prepilin peptidase CpaA